MITIIITLFFNLIKLMDSEEYQEEGPMQGPHQDFEPNYESGGEERFEDISFYLFFAALIVFAVFIITILILRLFFNQGSKSFKTKRIQVQIILLGFSFQQLTSLDQTKFKTTSRAFNPQEIFEIPQKSSLNQDELRKKYKKLSIKLHPDKNRNDPHANEKFDLLKKSQSTLTEPEKYRNWVEQGNPDGVDQSRMMFAMPDFSKMSKERKTIVLVSILCVVVIATLQTLFCVLGTTDEEELVDLGQQNPRKDQYEILGLDKSKAPEYSATFIKDTYSSLKKKMNKKKNFEQKQTEMEIEEAYKTLKNEKTRLDQDSVVLTIPVLKRYSEMAEKGITSEAWDDLVNQFKYWAHFSRHSAPEFGSKDKSSAEVKKFYDFQGNYNSKKIYKITDKNQFNMIQSFSEKEKKADRQVENSSKAELELLKRNLEFIKSKDPRI